MTAYSQILSLYDAYVDRYREPDGSLPEMMQLKRIHTAFVVRNAEAIAEGESFDGLTREVARIAALLHDTGRYEQLRRYNTFKDSESVDHAVFSHDIVTERGWLDRIEAIGEGEGWKDAVLKAVLYHNRRDLPEEIRDPNFAFAARLNCAPLLRLTSLAAHTVRDADKIDIFRVLEERLSDPEWRKDTRAFWNLTIEAAPNPDVVRAIEALRPVDYNAIRSLADFVLIQVGWMISGLFFATSRRLCRERGHLAFRRSFLHQLTDDPAIDRICDLAETKLASTGPRDSCPVGNEGDHR